MKDKILKILYEAGGFVSGEKISKQLGVSRSYVWKIIGKLKAEGYRITSVENKGYLLEKDNDIISEIQIKQGLSTKYIGQSIYCFDNLPSTNSYAKDQVDAVHGSVYIADSQGSGKGRRGKDWFSPPGVGIWMSICLKPDISLAEVMRISIANGMAVCCAIKNITGLEPKIKWPNDIVIDGKKVCGILTEMVTEEQNIVCAVTGMGINVNNESFPQDIQDMATSLYLQSGKKYLRCDIIREVLFQFEVFYGRLNDKQLIKDYENMCLNIGKEVVASNINGEISGTAVGVSDGGELIIKKADGQLISVSSGEVSVRGIYGYI